jgi:hypothetical protein
MNNTPTTNELKQNLIDELNATMNPAHVCRYAMREAVDVCGKLERENNELRAIFPKILQALESGACTDDCSIEFLRHIPNEVASVTNRLRRENNELRQELDKLKKFVSKDYEAVKKIFGVNQ